MPLYKGNTEIASGKLYKADTNIENGYKGTDSFYINEVTISFLNFPGVSDYSITGAPGESIPGNRYQQWTETASSGYAFNGTQTASGLPTDFTFTQGQQGSTSYTTTSPRVNYSPSTFPTSSVSVDYNSLTVSLPQTQVLTLSYTFTGTYARSTSCVAFAGGSCGVSSASSSLVGAYWNASASGTGGYGLNSCSQGCSVSISSSGGSSSCNSNGSDVSQYGFLSASVVCNIPYRANPYTHYPEGVYSCHRFIPTSGPSSFCGGIQANYTHPNGSTAGLSLQSSCSASNPPTDIFNTNGWNTIRNGISQTNTQDQGTYTVGWNRSGGPTDSCSQNNS